MSTWFLPFFHISSSSENGVYLSNILQLLSLLTQCYHLFVVQHCSIFPHKPFTCSTIHGIGPSPPHLFFFFGAGDLVQIFVHVGQMFCHWALAPGKVDYPDIETAQMMSLLHTLQRFATTLSPQSELLPMDSWIWKSVLFFLTECWDFPLLKTEFTHSPLSFLIMPCFSQLNSLWACSFLNFFHSTYNHCSLKNKNQNHYHPAPRHKSISSSDISSRSIFDYLP